MLFRLFLLFTLVPLVELALLIRVGNVIGVFWTIVLVVTTGLLGASLARWQGWQTWRKFDAELRSGRFPAAEIIDGLLILIAGALLVTPGILTDAVGFLLLVPFVRARIRGRFTRRWQSSVQMRSFTFRDEKTVEGEFSEPQDRIVDVKVIDPSDKEVP